MLMQPITQKEDTTQVVDIVQAVEATPTPTPTPEPTVYKTKYPVPQPREGCMSIEEYVYSKDITLSDFAFGIGYGLGYLCQCKNGSLHMSKRMKYLIDKYTKGKVKLI